MKTKKARVTLAGKGICCSLHLSVERCASGIEGWVPDAEHNGIFKSNLTAGKKRENSSTAFGKTAVSNEPLGNAFFRNDALQRCKEAGRLQQDEVVREIARLLRDWRFASTMKKKLRTCACLISGAGFFLWYLASQNSTHSPYIRQLSQQEISLEQGIVKNALGYLEAGLMSAANGDVNSASNAFAEVRSATLGYPTIEGFAGEHLNWAIPRYVEGYVMGMNGDRRYQAANVISAASNFNLITPDFAQHLLDWYATPNLKRR